MHLYDLIDAAIFLLPVLLAVTILFPLTRVLVR